MSKPIQLLSKNGDQYEVNTGEINRILDKIGDKNVAIVSINGNKRTGKSFLLNYFLRFLKYNKSHGNQWINGVNEETLNGFHWRGGAERDTVGIWMWSEPYIVKDKYGNDIALLLLDTQGNFDDKTTLQECGIIFSLSLLMSSTLILNINRDLSEDKLQFVEFFTTFAESFSGESQYSEALFQKLVFLVRDWENDEDFPFGYHDQYTPITKNYMRGVIISNSEQCLEAQNTRKEILRYFNYVSSYLMPHPGKHVSKRTFNGQNSLMDSEFLDSIENFVPIMLDSHSIEPKTIGGQLLTGNILKQYISKWAEVIRTQKIPEAKSFRAATAEINYTLALKHALNLYHDTVSAFVIESKPTAHQLCSYHETAKQKSLDYFVTQPKVRISEEKKSQMCDDLVKGMEQTFLILRTNNNNRIDKEASEVKLKASVEAQLELQYKLEENSRENSKQLKRLQNKISDVQMESKEKEAEQEKRFKEENDRMRQNMDHQNEEHRKMLAELERTHAQQRDEFIKKNNEITQQKLKEIEEFEQKSEKNLKKLEKKMKKQMEEQRKESERERENVTRMLDKERRDNEEKQRMLNEVRRDTVTRTTNRDNKEDDNRNLEMLAKVFSKVLSASGGIGGGSGGGSGGDTSSIAGPMRSSVGYPPGAGDYQYRGVVPPPGYGGGYIGGNYNNSGFGFISDRGPYPHHTGHSYGSFNHHYGSGDGAVGSSGFGLNGILGGVLASGGRRSDKADSGGRSLGRVRSGGRASGSSGKPSGGAGSDDNPSDNAVSGVQPSGRASSGGQPSSSAGSGGQPSGNTDSGGKPSGNTSSDGQPSGSAGSD